MKVLIAEADNRATSEPARTLKAGWVGRCVAWLRDHSRTRRVQTVLDQVIVSGSNFATGILLVRGLGLVEFGRFTIAYAVLLLANSIQLSFIASPMITLGGLCVDLEQRGRFVRGMFGVQVVFCGIVAVLAPAGSATYIGLHRHGTSFGFLLPFAAAVITFLLQDWLRRYYFTIGKAAACVWNDAVSYAGQVGAVCLLWRVHRLSMESTLWAIAMTSGVAFAAGAVIERLGCTREETSDAWRKARGISFHLGLSNQLQWLVYQGAMLVGAGVVGPQVAGGVRATQNIIGPVNMAYQAMENLVPLKAAEEMRKGGIQRASAFLLRFGWKGFICLLVFFATAALFSRRFLQFFYGHQLHGYAAVLDLQMLYFLLAWPLRQLTFLFRTMTRTRPILMASCAAAAVSLALVYPCVRTCGAAGIMVAAVAGQLMSLIYLGLAWMSARSRESVR
jgi:O-antigen/teichoic acid export membrane protein